MSYVANVFAANDAQRRVANIQAKRQEMGPARLAQVASDPRLPSRAIAAEFGYGTATFFVRLSQDLKLWEIYVAGRERAGRPVNKGRQRRHGGTLPEDDQKIVDAIANGARTVGEIEAAAKVDPRVFASRLYNLENELHEIWSQAIGRPPVTHYFLRGESEPPAVAGGQAKGAAA